MLKSPDLCPAASDVRLPGSTDIDRAVELILEKLAEDPTTALALLPGYIISPAPMTPAVRAALYLPKATEKRRADNQERLTKVWQVIDDQLARHPHISDFDLATELNRAGLHTYNKLRFTASKVRILLNKRGARQEHSPERRIGRP